MRDIRHFRKLHIALAAASLALSGCGEFKDVHHPGSPEHDDFSVRNTIQTLDQTTLPAEQLADLYLDDAVILRPGLPEVRGRAAIVALMKEQAAGPALEMTHRIDEIARFDDVIVVQGGVTGEARPADGSGPFPFATQNLIVFKRNGKEVPKIWKVIYNAAPEAALNGSSSQ